MDPWITEVKKLVGEDNVISDPDTEKMVGYARDESGVQTIYMPDAVVKPSTVEEISGIMRIANRETIPVTVRGAGSNLVGSCLPVKGGILISTERMNHIIEIDRENMVAVVEPGVITKDLCEAVEKEALYYAGYPMSVETSTIGGNVAHNAGGGTVIRYGNTGKHVLGLEVVLPDGDIVSPGGKRRKDTNGYNLVQLFIQSEGTLGIFTKIILNLLPLPGPRATLLMAFNRIEDAVKAAPKLMTGLRSLPLSIELMDRETADLCSEYLHERFPVDIGNAYILLQLESDSEETLFSLCEKAESLSGSLETFIAENKSESDRLWRMRMSAGEAGRAKDPFVGLEEVVVPLSKIPEIADDIKKIADMRGIKCFLTGHIGDGNIHLMVMKPEGVKPEDWPEILEVFMQEVCKRTIALGGDISGEHGIGLTRKKILKETRSREIELMKSIKRAIDPEGILNPGKIFD